MVRTGDIWILGGHRLMCGDCLKPENVAALLAGIKPDLLFTDPPYGMKKESSGIKNDNLNQDKLLDFNRVWFPIALGSLKDNGSAYVWGNIEPLMDFYSEIIKPLIRKNALTFRNLIVWDKGFEQGQKSPLMRQYVVADEKCIFVMKGVQGFNNNADHFYEGFEPIRKYLFDSRMAMGWDVATMKSIVGHSDKSRDHWTSPSQFELLTRKNYQKLAAQAERERHEKGLQNDAFTRDYDELKREYEQAKNDYNATRAYFDNAHDNMNAIWRFPRTSVQERAATKGFSTPKPIELCERAIKSSSREGESVLDVFGGSGSTLIACERLNRRCYMMEISETYCENIIQRWQDLTGKLAYKEDLKNA